MPSQNNVTLTQRQHIYDPIELAEPVLRPRSVYEPVTQQLAFTVGDDKEIVFLDPRTDAITGKLKLESAKLEHPTSISRTPSHS